MKLRLTSVIGATALVFASIVSVSFAADKPALLSRLGAFNRAVSYVWKYVPAELSYGAHPWGANIAEAWIYARVFTKSGKQYVLMRTVSDLTTRGMTLTTDGKNDTRVSRQSGDITRSVDPADGLVFSGKEFELKLSPGAVSWTDQSGQTSLKGSGSPLGNVGTSAFIPYVQDDGSTGIDMYTGQYQPVTGTVFGEPVTGMFVIDHFIGTERFRGSHLSDNQIIWFKFANVYEDGSVEMGEIFSETNGMHGGVVTDGTKEIFSSTDPKVKFVFDGKENLVKETWTMNGAKWEMRPDNTGARHLGNTGIQQVWGGVHRVGDKRKIVNQFAITEYRINLLTPEQR